MLISEPNIITQLPLFYISEKTCKLCGKTKPLDDFYLNRSNKYACKSCLRERSKKYHAEHIEKCKANERQWRKKNKAHSREYSKEYFAKEENRLRRNANRRKSAKNNMPKILAYQKEYKRKHRKTAKGAIDHRMSRRMCKVLKGVKNNTHWSDLVSYTVLDLEYRLRKTLPKGYTWDDFLSGELHIDHIIPLCTYKYEDPTEMNFQKAWGLENLQLLPALKNMQKGGKIEHPVQVYLPLRRKDEPRTSQ